MSQYDKYGNCLMAMNAEELAEPLTGLGSVTVVNRHHDKHYDQYIGRGTVFGNPYKMADSSDAERDRVIQKHKILLDQNMQDNHTHLYQGVMDLAKRVAKGEHLKIGCSCKPKACHGDYLAEVIFNKATELANLDAEFTRLVKEKLILEPKVTIVGSRETPPEILSFIAKLSRALQEKACIRVRTGDAKGADAAAASCGLDLEMWKALHADDPNCEGDYAYELAAKYHPYLHRCNAYVKKLHARNVFQVLGAKPQSNPDPSVALMCWTPDGCETHTTRNRNTGGTGTAISIADKYDVPVFNLKNPNRINEFYDHLENLGLL